MGSLFTSQTQQQNCKMIARITWAGGSRRGRCDSAFSNYVDSQSERGGREVATWFCNNAHTHLLWKVLVQCRSKHRHYLNTTTVVSPTVSSAHMSAATS